MIQGERENPLNETEDLYRFVVGFSNDGFALSDQGRIISVNQRFLDIFGYQDQDQVLDHSIDDFVHPDDRARIFAIHQRRESGEEVPARYEFLGVRRDGGAVDIEVSSRAASYRGKRLSIAYLRDISDRKESERRNDENKERYQALFNHMSNGVSILGAVDHGEDFVFLDFNQAGERIENIARKELVGRRVTEVFPGIRKFGLLEVFKKVWQTGRPMHHPISMYKDNRISGWRENYVYKLPTGEIVAIYSDETEKKIAHEALKKSESEKRAILEGISSGIQLIDGDHKILWLNRASTDLINKPLDELIGKDCYQVMRGLDEPCEDCPMERVVRSGESEQLTRYRDDGRILHQRFEPVLNDSSRVMGVIKISNDITEKNSLETQLRQAQKMKAIGTLAGGIAHDFNNILYAMVGFTELSMGQVDKDSKLHDFLLEVLKAGDRARDLIDQILTFSRKNDFELKPVQIDIMIKETIKLLKASLPSTIRITQNIGSKSRVMCDATQIHQILLNLCTNAGHAMRESGGVLDIKLTDLTLDREWFQRYPELTPGPYLSLSISDTGPGISPEHMEHIFEPFYTTKSQGEGTGLGLSVVHGIVKSLGGGIHAQSKPGKGVAMEVLLPVVDMPAEAASKTEMAYKTGSERILIIDDESAILTVEDRTLTSLGYDVTGTSDTREALGMFQSNPEAFDLIITDMTMPGMTGDKLACEIRKIREDIPIILCTGYNAEVKKEHAASVGINSIISKPIKKAEMSEAVREVLDR